jgi:hypothetical protein
MNNETYLGLFEISKRLNISFNQAKWFARRYLSQIRFQKKSLKDKLYNLEDFNNVVEARKKFWEEKTKSQLNQNK